jgi:hypothetical protein
VSLGNYPIGSLIETTFTTRFTGTPTTLVGGIVAVYRDADTVQSTAGLTLTADFDSTTGLNHLAIDTSADFNFYISASSFSIVLTGGTVGIDDVTGMVVDDFTINALTTVTPTDLGATTALDLIREAFEELNVFLPGEQIPAADGAKGLRVLNRLLGSWAQQHLTVPYRKREVFALSANRGGPTTPYTIGPGGDFHTTRPPNRESLVRAGLLLGDSSNYEYAVPLFMPSAYETLSMKTQTSAFFQGVYYQPSHSAGFGAIYLWPVPDTALHSLVLYQDAILTTFPTLQTGINLPQGYEDALIYDLARRLATPYGRQVTPELTQKAMHALAVLKRANFVMPPELTNYFATGPMPYDLLTGE